MWRERSLMRVARLHSSWAPHSSASLTSCAHSAMNTKPRRTVRLVWPLKTQCYCLHTTFCMETERRSNARHPGWTPTARRPSVPGHTWTSTAVTLARLSSGSSPWPSPARLNFSPGAPSWCDCQRGSCLTVQTAEQDTVRASIAALERQLRELRSQVNMS